MYEIIDHILSKNIPANQGRIIFQNLKKALEEKSAPARKKLLRNCGFIVEEGPHDKIIFHDNKYSFTISNSPSDFRATKNLYSDIVKNISVYVKLF